MLAAVRFSGLRLPRYSEHRAKDAGLIAPAAPSPRKSRHYRDGARVLETELRDGRRLGNADRFRHTAFRLLRNCNIVALLLEEYDERVRHLELFPLHFLILRSSKPAIISPTRGSLTAPLHEILVVEAGSRESAETTGTMEIRDALQGSGWSAPDFNPSRPDSPGR